MGFLSFSPIAETHKDTGMWKAISEQDPESTGEKGKIERWGFFKLRLPVSKENNKQNGQLTSECLQPIF